MNAMEETASVIEQPQGIHIRHRRHACACPAVLHLFFRLGTVNIDEGLIFLRESGQPLHQFTAGRILSVKSELE